MAAHLDECIGVRVRRVRESRGLTTAELANAAGVAKGLVQNIENGTASAIPLLVGLKLAHALNVEPWWLASGVEHPRGAVKSLKNA